MLLLIAVVAGGALLRFYHLGFQSLWLDELGQATVARGPWSDLFDGIASRAGDAPLDYLGVRFMTAIVGHGSTGTRAWSWLCGAAGIAAVAWLAWEAFRSRAVVVLASLLVAVSSFHIGYSQEARPYALAFLVGVACLAAFMAARRLGTFLAWLGFGTLIAVALYSHYFLVVVPTAVILGSALMAAHAVVTERQPLLTAMRDALPQIASVLFGVALFSPWLLLAVASQGARHHEFPVPPLLDSSAYDSALIGLLAPAFAGAQVPVVALVGVRVIEIVAIVGIVGSRSVDRMNLLVLVLVSVLAIPLAFVVDMQSGYFFAERQVILLLAPILCFAAAGIVVVGRFVAHLTTSRSWGSAAAIATTLLALLYGSTTLTAASSEQRTKEDWRTAAQWVRAGVCPEGQVFVNIGDGYAYGIGYYQPSLVPLVVEVEPTTPNLDEIVDKMRDAGLERRDWAVFRASSSNADQVNSAISWLAGRGWAYDWQLGLAVVTPPESC